MAFSAWRGIAGIIHPTLRPGAVYRQVTEYAFA